MTSAPHQAPLRKERPILFKDFLVRKILAGQKWQTRRLVTPPVPGDRGLEVVPHRIEDVPGGRWCARLIPVASTFGPDGDPGLGWRKCPYGQAGDRIWVKETWAPHPDGDGIVYRATDPGWDDEETGIRWRPSIFMSRQKSRITLDIKSVRVERVQDISDEDILAEGFDLAPSDKYPGVSRALRRRQLFSEAWDRINAHRGGGWADNPWVWVIEWPPLQKEGQ